MLTVSPVVFAWLIPYVSWLRPSLVAFFGLIAASYAAVFFVLVSTAPSNLKIAVIIVQSGVVGALNPASDVFLWEVMGRGVAASRRGLTLALAFGVGPVLAAFSSFASELILKGKLFDWVALADPLNFPWNYAVLFGAAAPMMALAALLCAFCVVPQPAREVGREPFVTGVLGGLWNFLASRVLLIAGIVIMIVYVGNTIPSNMSLYMPLATGSENPGLANAFRFSFKAVAGLLLGWILTKSHPKAGLLITSSLFVLSQIWAIFVSGEWYLVAFGIYGAGELVGVYGPNYVLSASRKADIRRNLAFTSLLNSPVAPMGNLFGAMSDHFAVPARALLGATTCAIGTSPPETSPLATLALLVPGQASKYGTPFGYQVTFALCAAIMLIGIALALFCLPARPEVPLDTQKPESR